MTRLPILLFTPYPPTQGGGSQNLRCAVAHLQGIDVSWAYLADRPVDFPGSIHLGAPLLHGGLLDAWRHFLGLSLGGHPAIMRIVDQLMAQQPARYWIVAHYEGLAVAQELIRRGADVHLSIHDDPPFALIARSRRYFPFTALCERQFAQVLRGARSIDVTSHPMAQRYRQRYGVASVAYFPYIDSLPTLPSAPAATAPLRIGFAGTLYTPREARAFAQGLQILSRRLSRPVEWHFWGLGLRQQAWVRPLPIPTFLHPFVPEADLPTALSSTHLLYANYPFDASSSVFRQTSHPAKLSTYLRAQRPIFAHTPLPSSLADFVQDTGLGLVCPHLSPGDIASALHLLIGTPIPVSLYAQAVASWYGPTNLQRLQQALLVS